jgi:hypothetical protein
VPLTPPAATVREELARRQLARGGWSYFDSNQVGIEPTCLAMLALSRHTGSHREVQKLLEWQNSDGSWPAFVGDGEGSWTTALALSTINILGGDNDAAGDKAAQWLLGTRGREGHWLWRWKFKLVDRQVRFDPDKFGWPWMPGSASWVIPTGFALIALKQRRACSDTLAAWIGDQIWAKMFGEHTDLARALGQAESLAAERNVAIRIVGCSADLDVPFELIRDRHKFLALEHPLIRSIQPAPNRGQAAPCRNA